MCSRIFFSTNQIKTRARTNQRMVGAGTMLDTETDGVLEPNRARLGPCSDEKKKKFAIESY